MSTADPSPTPSAGRAPLVLASLVIGFDAFVYGIGIPVLPMHMSRSGLAIGDTGLLFAAFAAAQVVALLFALRYASRISPQRLLWIGFTCSGVSAVAMALAAASIPGLFAARALHGLGGALVWIGGPALVTRCVAPEARGGALGIVLGGGAVGSLIGPLAGGALYDWGGFSAPYWIAGAVAVALVAGFAFVLRGAVGARLAGLAPAGGAGVDLVRLCSRRSVVGVIVVVACASAALGLLEPLVPAVLFETAGTSGLENGVIFGLAVLFYGLTAPVAGTLSDRMGPARVSIAGLGLLALAFCLLPFGTSQVAMAGVAAVVGVALGLALAPTMPALAAAVDAQSDGQSDYSTVYALHSLVYAGGLFVGPSVGGQAVERYGLDSTSVVLAIISAAVAALAWHLSRPARR